MLFVQVVAIFEYFTTLIIKKQSEALSHRLFVSIFTWCRFKCGFISSSCAQVSKAGIRTSACNLIAIAGISATLHHFNCYMTSYKWTIKLFFRSSLLSSQCLPSWLDRHFLGQIDSTFASINFVFRAASKVEISTTRTSLSVTRWSVWVPKQTFSITHKFGLATERSSWVPTYFTAPIDSKRFLPILVKMTVALVFEMTWAIFQNPLGKFNVVLSSRISSISKVLVLSRLVVFFWHLCLYVSAKPLPNELGVLVSAVATFLSLLSHWLSGFSPRLWN